MPKALKTTSSIGVVDFNDTESTRIAFDLNSKWDYQLELIHFSISEQTHENLLPISRSRVQMILIQFSMRWTADLKNSNQKEFRHEGNLR